MYNCLVYRRWLDKLGLAAKLGLDVVIRQVLIGSGTYHLVDNNLDPLPVSVFYGFDLCCITSVSVQSIIRFLYIIFCIMAGLLAIIAIQTACWSRGLKSTSSYEFRTKETDTGLPSLH